MYKGLTILNSLAGAAYARFSKFIDGIMNGQAHLGVFVIGSSEEDIAAFLDSGSAPPKKLFFDTKGRAFCGKGAPYSFVGLMIGLVFFLKPA